MSEITGQNFIAGVRSAKGSTTLQSIGAADGQVIDLKFIEATPEEITTAAESAAEAFAAYRTTSPEVRATFLETIADEIDTLGEDVIKEVIRETGLPEGRLNGERTRTSNQMRLFAKVLRRGDYLGVRIDRADADRTPPKPDIRQYKVALGPVAVFGASNFPFAFSVGGGDTASALAAGCPVVVKAHPGHMVTSEHVANAITRAVEKCGMPKGVFSMVYGDRVGAQLVQEPAIKAVGFTGSQKGGRALFELASQRDEPIPVFAEMSSVNPMLVLPQALEQRGEQIAVDMASSVVLGCGQFCTNPGIIIGLKSEAMSRFTAKLGDELKAKPGQVMLNPGLVENYKRGVERLNALDGVEELATGESEGQYQGAARLFKAEKHVLFEHQSPLFEEVFGPCTVVTEVDSPEELQQAARSLNGQLTATLIAEESDLTTHQGLLPILEERAGRVLLNGYPTGVEVCDAMVHGGPYPATSDSRGTSVGTLAIERYLRPVCYQNYPDAFLPEPLKNANPFGLMRLIDGENSRDAL
ncbi:aldehyde dehydrogenase (NADP(+)) [Phytohalomonas tamaricis]|uniref:aldehyde dehydrogenase (NADP(+)) n=1 Tax=Phytohalomonas tamaricis TaxID=2081032 RepID=UPI000D0AF02E|nr:aldehyde dehydrogenase (NADP(+)) [Phytohalomonas tamaricis]